MLDAEDDHGAGSGVAVLVECIFLIFSFPGHICTKMRWLVCAVLLASIAAKLPVCSIALRNVNSQFNTAQPWRPSSLVTTTDSSRTEHNNHVDDYYKKDLASYIEAARRM